MNNSDLRPFDQMTILQILAQNHKRFGPQVAILVKISTENLTKSTTYGACNILIFK